MLEQRFGFYPSGDYVHRFCDRQHISNRHVKHASSGEFDANAYSRAVQLFEYLILLNIKVGETAFMDGKRLMKGSALAAAGAEGKVLLPSSPLSPPLFPPSIFFPLFSKIYSYFKFSLIKY